MPPITINELLCFVSNQFDKLDRGNLTSIILTTYTHDELVASKIILVAECSKIDVTTSISEFKKKRLNTISTENVKKKSRERHS